MKKLALLGVAFLTAYALIAFTSVRNPAPFDVAAYKAKSLVRCTPDWEALSGLLDAVDIPPMPDAGRYKWKINTTNDSAQFYFNQGINMYYGFHIIEAIASFKKAARLDPNHPMVWWAQALAYGPNINDVGYSASPEALDVTAKAVALLDKASPVEKALITAMQVRYTADTTQSREQLNEAYTAAMKKAYGQYPANPDVAALYADAMMLQHPWDLWHPNGKAKPWTPAIRTVLEKLLVDAPNHPGANHYYIHVMEASPMAYKALPSADRLGTLTPGLSHMVHMPSHIYLRTGQFNKGTRINEEAVARYQQYKSLFPMVQENAFLYQWHNLHMQANCALMAGRAQYARETAQDLQKVMDTAILSTPAPLGNYLQYMYMTPVLVNVHFSKWDDVLAAPAPAPHHVYATALYHFARGAAHAGKEDLAKAKEELSALQQLRTDPALQLPMGPFSPAAEGAKVATALLKGMISTREANVVAAIDHFKEAAALEEAMVYTEPRDWMLNPKQYLGAAYVRAKQWQNAENVFKRDLNQNVQNVWSLYGLLEALNQQNKKAEANIIGKQLDIAMKESDTELKKSFMGNPLWVRD
jgi:tetratricopeptide (TPR) repeat protein